MVDLTVEVVAVAVAIEAQQEHHADDPAGGASGSTRVARAAVGFLCLPDVLRGVRRSLRGRF